MKIQWKKLVICVAIPLAVGGLASLLTMNGMKEFGNMEQPPLSPPAWLFPVAWSVLYILMGAACYIVLVAPRRNNDALLAYGVQLFMNFFWTILFFGIGSTLTAFIWLLLLFGAVVWTAVLFFRVDKTAGRLLVPYALWVLFAGYLNLGVYILNR
ncbi:MAG: tryptophan-rich sensory protein [Clostridia bacterium]|nr:tryptophan-rich sensory protein [Clostridia bacterium]